jgi:uncharacterized repeat protein (TIGR03803 family)
LSEAGLQWEERGGKEWAVVSDWHNRARFCYSFRVPYLYSFFRKVRIRALLTLLVVAVAAALATSARAQGYGDLYDFQLGDVPVWGGIVTDSSGNHYGTLEATIAQQQGVIYEITAGGTFEILHSFEGSVQFPDGSFGPDGGYPGASVVFDSAGDMFGTAFRGGEYGTGLVWEIPNGASYKVIHSFGGQTTYTNGQSGSDGVYPTSNLAIDSAGNIIGDTTYGGAHDGGVVWKITSGGTYQDLYDMPLGYNLYAPVTLDPSGNIFGTSGIGGAYYGGVLWKLSTGGTFSVLHMFGNGADGAYPGAGPVAVDSNDNVYGNTEQGGANDAGVIWECTSAGTYKILHDFGGTATTPNGQTEPDGQYDQGGGVILDKSGNLFGVEIDGGPNPEGDGMIWELTSFGEYVDLHDFAGQPDGGNPVSQVSLDSDGNMYGVAEAGGANGCGMIWEISAITGISLTPSPAVAGSTVTGTVTTSFPAPAGGWKVNLTSSSSHIIVPASVTIPEGTTSATFIVTTLDNSSAYSGVVTANDGCVIEQTQLSVQPLYISGFTIGPSPISAGNTAVGTVTLSQAAPAGGRKVYLTSSTSYIPVPTFITVPGGSTTQTFNVAPSDYKSNYSAVIEASDSGSSQNATLSVVSTYLTAISAAPNPVVAGVNSTGTVTISQPAPVGGWTVKLSSNTTYVGVPSSVVIPNGAQSATFPVTTKNYDANYTASINASDGITSSSTAFSVSSIFLTGISASPNPVTAGGTSTGTVTISQPAPAGGWTVNLTSNTPYVGIPTSVVIPNGAKSATFPVTTKNYSANYTATITGKDSVSTESTALTVNAITIATLSLSPSSVANGTSSQGTVTLSGPAPAGGLTIQLASSQPNYASVPASINIPGGASQGVFSVTTGIGTVKFVVTLTITASDLPSAKSASLQLTP